MAPGIWRGEEQCQGGGFCASLHGRKEPTRTTVLFRTPGSCAQAPVSGLKTSPRPCVPIPSLWRVSSTVGIFQKTEPLRAVRFPGPLWQWCSPGWEPRLTRLMKIGLMGSPCKYKVLTAPQRLCTLKMKGNHPVNRSVLFPRWTELFVMFRTE